MPIGPGATSGLGAACRRPRSMDLDECWHRLTTERVGRVAFLDDARLQVVPVGYVTHARSIFFRTIPDGAAGGLRHHQPASFEIDHTDEVAQTGWSVLAAGHAYPVPDAAALDYLWADRPSAPWDVDPPSTTVRVVVERVTGHWVPV